MRHAPPSAPTRCAWVPGLATPAVTDRPAPRARFRTRSRHDQRPASRERDRRRCAAGAPDRQAGGRQERDAVCEAVPDDPAQHAAVVPQAQLDLHRSDVGDAAGFLDLSDRDVAQPHRLDQAAPRQRVQRANAGGQRHARIRRVKLVERNPLEPQRAQARFARRRQRPRPAVGFPSSAGPGQATLGGDTNLRRSPVQVASARAISRSL